MTETNHGTLAVLVSGGLDSAVMLGMAVDDHSTVYPLYIRSGLASETNRARTPSPTPGRIARPQIAASGHAGNAGRRFVWRPLVPFRPQCAGRRNAGQSRLFAGSNLLCCPRRCFGAICMTCRALALAILAANPFPDATPEFFRSFTAAVNLAVVGNVQVVTPFAGLSKADVIRRGRDLPLRHSLSCLSPLGGRHCGRCDSARSGKRHLFRPASRSNRLRSTRC